MIDCILHTSDGGENWHLDAKIKNTFLSDICYDGGKSVYVVGSYGVMARYTDPSLADGKDDSGEDAAFGLYFYTIQVGKYYTDTRKMIMLQ